MSWTLKHEAQGGSEGISGDRALIGQARGRPRPRLPDLGWPHFPTHGAILSSGAADPRPVATTPVRGSRPGPHPPSRPQAVPPQGQGRGSRPVPMTGPHKAQRAPPSMWLATA